MSNKTVNKTLEIEGSSLKVTQASDKAIFVENSTEFLLYQALRRRGLALEFADLVTNTVHQKWVDFLFSELTKEPVKGFQKVQTFQILRADKAAWVHMADVCSDIRPSVGARPLDALFPTLTTVHSVVFTLFPMQGNLAPWQGKGKDFQKGKSKGRSDGAADQWQDRPAPYYGPGKGKGGKSSKDGKGKNPGNWERRPNMPRLLLGLHYKHPCGKPLCFAHNLPGGCSKAKDGAECDRGMHNCCKCLGSHSYNDCPQREAN